MLPNCLHATYHISQHRLTFCLYFSLFVTSASTSCRLPFASIVKSLKDGLPFTLFFYSAQHKPSEQTAVIKATRDRPLNRFHKLSVRLYSDLAYANGCGCIITKYTSNTLHNVTESHCMKYQESAEILQKSIPRPPHQVQLKAEFSHSWITCRLKNNIWGYINNILLILNLKRTF